MLKMRGNVPRRVPKITSSERKRRQKEIEERIIEEAARLKAQVRLDNIQELPIPVKEAIGRVVKMDFMEFVQAVKDELGGENK